MPKDSSTRHRHSSATIASHRPPLEPDLTSLAVDVISSDDYFLKSDHFRLWLKQYKGKYFDELSGDKARHYFDKFVKVWNRGELSSEIYNPPSSQRAASQTGYKWSFATKLGITEDQKGTSADAKALEAVRESVVNATAGAGVGDSGESSGTGSALGKSKESVRRMGPIGPSLPPGSGRDHTDSLSSLTEADRQFARETQVERQALSRATRRPVDKSEGEVYAGKEKQLENRRAKREENKVFREAREAGKGIDDDVGEDVLMGGGARDSFAAQVAARDAARARAAARREGRRSAASMSATGQSTTERRQAILEKDRQTMEMFKAMAKERFGTGSGEQ